MFTVYDCGHIVKFPSFKAIGDGKDASFKSFEEALVSAKVWLRDYGSRLPYNWDGSPFDYSGSGMLLEIRSDNTDNMNSNPFFDKNGNYTKVANVIDQQIHSNLLNIMNDWHKYYPQASLREITLLVLNAAASATNEFILEHKK